MQPWTPLRFVRFQCIGRTLYISNGSVSGIKYLCVTRLCVHAEGDLQYLMSAADLADQSAGRDQAFYPACDALLSCASVSVPMLYLAASHKVSVRCANRLDSATPKRWLCPRVVVRACACADFSASSGACSFGQDQAFGRATLSHPLLSWLSSVCMPF